MDEFIIIKMIKIIILCAQIITLTTYTRGKKFERNCGGGGLTVIRILCLPSNFAYCVIEYVK